jgi:hypothetical protein
MRLKVGCYRQAIKLKVPPLYPEDGVTVEFLGSNFPPEIQYMFRCQGRATNPCFYFFLLISMMSRHVPILSAAILSCAYSILPCPALLYSILPSPILSCHALPYCTPSCPPLFCHAFLQCMISLTSARRSLRAIKASQPLLYYRYS